MRADGCAAQHALASEAAIIVKQSVNLARRRGQSQVTPLHVASTMLSSAGLFRAACLQSHSHPLQCKALELCINVALNRLPTTSTILTTQTSYHHHHNYPTLSNALIAAFKRAQAHQRRGSVETQQPLLAVKIELDQLIVSVLDDPSVSRVMREAGFSSTQVKSHVEKSLFVETNNGNNQKEETTVAENKVMKQVRSEDVNKVLDCLSSGSKRCVVVVAEYASTSESVIRVVMDKIAKAEVSEGLRNTELIPLPLSLFRAMTREEVRSKVLELRTLVTSCCLGRRGAMFVIEDLKWVCEAWEETSNEKKRKGGNNDSYSPIEHMIMEISSLVLNSNMFGERVWLFGFCTSESYARCRAGQPSLEALWCIHPISVSDGGLRLSLNCESENNKGNIGSSSCCSSIEGGQGSDINCLPSWHSQDEQNQQGSSLLKDASMKWNSIGNTSPRRQNDHAFDLTLNFPFRSSSTSICMNPSFHPLHHQTFSLSSGNHFLPLDNSNSTLDPNARPSSSSSDGTTKTTYFTKFKELNASNLKTLCNELEKNVPWQKDIMPEIASTLLRCRSGMMRTKERSNVLCGAREETWFFFQGTDRQGKYNVSRELARLVFGSHEHFIAIEFSTLYPCAQFDSTSDIPKKRTRLEIDCGHGLEQVFDALSENPHRVIFLEDVDKLDYDCLICIKSAINCGRLRSHSGDEVRVEDAIVVLSCNVFDSRSRADPPTAKHKVDHDEEKHKDSSLGLDLNLNLCVDDYVEGRYDNACLLEAVDQVVGFEKKDNL